MQEKKRRYVEKGIWIIGITIVIGMVLYHAFHYRSTLHGTTQLHTWQEEIEERIETLQQEEYKQIAHQLWEGIEQFNSKEHTRNSIALVGAIGVVSFLGYMIQQHTQKNTQLRIVQQEEKEKLEWEQAVEQAIQNEEWKVYYQPKIDLKTEKPIGAEALVRWEKDGEMLSPHAFIPILEQYGWIHKLDKYVFTKVCEEQAKWKQTYQSNIIMAVNISKQQLREQTIEDYVAITEQYGVERQYIELEITESTAMEDEEIARNIFLKIKEAGFLLSIDDFGTGYSSLSMLQDMPIDILKIDKVFLQKADMQKETQNMIEYILFIAKHLQLKTLVEGVETKEQVEFLKALECDMVQGYYFAHEMDIQNLQKFIRNE